MLPKPPACNGCILHTKGQGFTLPSGTGTSGVLILGEAPGKEESETGTPFVGRAGKQLTRSFDRLGVARSKSSIYNLTQCRPPNNWLQDSPWEIDSISWCLREHLGPHVAAVRPKVLSLQGALPLKHILKLGGLLPSSRNNAPKRGYIFDCTVPTPDGDYSCLAIPTVHPSFIIQGNQNYAGVHYADLKRSLQVAKEGEVTPDLDFVLHPSHADIEEFVKDCYESPLNLLSADIETYYSGNHSEDELTLEAQDITRVSFSFNSSSAITIPIRGNRQNIQKILDIPFKHICWWNGLNFDIPLLKDKGYTFKAKHLDGMAAWKFLQSDLPQGLGFVSTFYTPFREWKSLSDVRPEYYSCMDAVACWLCTKGIVDVLKEQEVKGL